MIYLLCGFMGSGKTSLLKRLKAQNTEPGASFFDLDEQLEQLHESTIEKLVESVGWETFRQKEAQQLAALLAPMRAGVIALGGGALEGLPEEFWRKQEQGELVFVWLNTPFETCWGRICSDATRPLVARGKSALEQLFSQRQALYARALVQLSPEEQIGIDTMHDLQAFC
jgi:shikimate kinase